MALLARYKSIPMPNLRLNDMNITQLLGYIDQESRRIGSLRAADAAPDHHLHHGDHAAPDVHAEHTAQRSAQSGDSGNL